MGKVHTRIAPSPTGKLHIGTARTALFNYLYARQQGGTFSVRIEDTDKERSTPAFEADIRDGLAWLDLNAEQYTRQSESLGAHTEALQQLIAEDKAYVSNEVAKDGSGREVAVVRLRNSGVTITFTDVIRGDVTFDTTELGDFVIARSVTDPLYHLAVVVDDAASGITHVIRGEDHLSNTPRQILIQEALGFERPVYAHLPLILAPDRSKLSKRKHATAISDYAAMGYLSDALTNYLALLGWHPEGDEEIFALEELVVQFDLTRTQKGGAIFDADKLRWLNREHLLRMPEENFAREALDIMKSAVSARAGITYNREVAARLIPVLRERIHAWGDIRDDAAAGEYDLYFTKPTLEVDKLPWKDTPASATKQHLEHLEALLADASFDAPDTIKNALWDYAESEGRGTVLWPLRYALTGKERSPDPFTVAYVLGKEETVKRVMEARELLTS